MKIGIDVKKQKIENRVKTTVFDSFFQGSAL